mgnify:CR=1 FL=1
MAWTQEKINETYAKLQQLAATDEEFRQELLDNSSAAIEKIAGEPLPEDFKIKVIENTPGYAATFVLPPMAEEELDENELDMVAGGTLCGADACAAHAKISK